MPRIPRGYTVSDPGRSSVTTRKRCPGITLTVASRTTRVAEKVMRSQSCSFHLVGVIDQ